MLGGYAVTVGIKLQEVGGSGRFAACTEASDATAGRKFLWCRTCIHPSRAQSAVDALLVRMLMHGG